jgi:hypothetical protein
MRVVWERFKALLGVAVKHSKVRKRLTLALIVVLVLQLYFVRELIAAELLFGLGFLVLVGLVGIFYLVGLIGERSLGLLETATHGIAPYARRGYLRVEELSKKPFRHPRSESAQ